MNHTADSADGRTVSLERIIQHARITVMRVLPARRSRLPARYRALVREQLWSAFSERSGYWLAMYVLASIGAAILAYIDGTVSTAPPHHLPFVIWLCGVWSFALPYAWLRRLTKSLTGKGSRLAESTLAWSWILWAATISAWWMAGAWCLTQPPPVPGRFIFGTMTFYWMTLLGHVFTVLFLAPSWRAIWASIFAGAFLPVMILALYPPANFPNTHFLVRLLCGEGIAYCLMGIYSYRDLFRLYARGVMLEDQRLQIEKASHDKNSFIASISHDLRQPLTALSLTLCSLEGRLTQDRQSLADLSEARRQAEAIEDMVNGALDLSRLEAGTWKTVIREIALPQLMNKVAMDLRNEAHERGLRIAVRCLPVLIRSDHLGLERILRNFLANAIRYSRPSDTLLSRPRQILLACQRRGGKVRISVIDRGIGIPTERLGEVFQEYVQLDNAERDRSKGFGLGLAIVRGLVHLLGHTLEVQSVLGRGSRFSVLVPLVGNIPPELLGSKFQVMENRDPIGMTVVVIEDDADVRNRVLICLSELGCRVISAEAASDVVKELAAAGQGLQPDFILSDYRLRNGKTGIQAIEAVRNCVGYHVPGAIWSGDTAPEVLREVARYAGDLELLTKPVPKAKLRQILTNADERRRRGDITRERV